MSLYVALSTALSFVDPEILSIPRGYAGCLDGADPLLARITGIFWRVRHYPGMRRYSLPAAAGKDAGSAVRRGMGRRTRRPYHAGERGYELPGHHRTRTAQPACR